MQTLSQRWSMLEPAVTVVGPDDDRARPAVILFHGCGGLRGHLPRYAAAAKAAGGDAGKPKTAGQETAEPKATSGFNSNAERAVTVGKCCKYRKVFAWSKHGGQAAAECAAIAWAKAKRAESGPGARGLERSSAL